MYELLRFLSYNLVVKLEQTKLARRKRFIYFKVLLSFVCLATHSVSLIDFTLVPETKCPAPNPNRLRKIRKKNM